MIFPKIIPDWAQGFKTIDIFVLTALASSICLTAGSNSGISTKSDNFSPSLICKRDRHSRLSINPDILTACVCIIVKNFSRACSSSLAVDCNVSIKPDKTDSGVRSSWLALAIKSACICSNCLRAVMSYSVKTITAPALAVAGRRSSFALNTFCFKHISKLSLRVSPCKIRSAAKGRY